MADKRKCGGKAPAHLAGPVSVEQRIWNTIRALAALGRPFTRADIEFGCGAKPRAVRGYVERLVQGGHLRGLNHLPKSPTCPHFTWQQYELARGAGLQAPRLRADGSPATLGGARERMWQTLRILKTFNALDVQLAVNAGGGQVAYTTAKTYLLKLAKAGYFVVTGKGASGRGKRGTQYRLLPSMNSGPRSPIAQKSGAIYDPNLGEVVWPR